MDSTTCVGTARATSKKQGEEQNRSLVAIFSRAISAVGLVLTFAQPLSAQAGTLNSVEFWNQELLQGIRNDLMSPTQAAYDIAIIDIAMYDAVDAATGLSYKPYNYTGGAVVSADAGAATFYAGEDTALSLFTSAASQTTLRDAANAYGDRFGYTSTPPAGSAIQLGQALGQTTAATMLARSASDGSLAPMPPFTGSTVPGQWRPTPPNYQDGITPNWGSVVPFVLTSGSEFRASPPPTLGSAAYNAALLQVQCMGGTTAPSASVCGQYAVTPAQKAANNATALFWSNDANGTYKPPGQWIQTAVTISTSLAKPLSLLQDARMFALLGTSLADAAIAQWDTKYYYNFWRPVTAINDPQYNPNPPSTFWYPAVSATDDSSQPGTTPAFPSYASGHSTFGAAATTALADFFGTNQFTFTVASDTSSDIRTYSSFSSAALEDGMSRIYGGWHFIFDDTAGLEMGTEVGNTVFADSFTPVPEPPAYALFTAGLFGLVVLRRRARVDGRSTAANSRRTSASQSGGLWSTALTLFTSPQAHASRP
jgi:membrane-associated phospholipid phosphatase